MNKRQTILFLTFICVTTSFCLGQSYWNREYGGTGFYSSRAIASSSDGNFIIVGSTGIDASYTSSDVYILKITPYGDTLWSKTYGGKSGEVAQAIIPTNDGNFIIAGKTLSFGAGYYDVYLLKINPKGDTLWTKTYGGTGMDRANTIIQTPDGNFIVAGDSWSFVKEDMNHDTNHGEVYLLKITPNGDTLWTRTYGGLRQGDRFGTLGDNSADNITITPNGNFIVVGPASVSFEYIYLLEIDPNGNKLWSNIYPTRTYGQLGCIAPTSDGNFIVACSGPPVENDAGKPLIMKVSPSGDTLWTKIIDNVGAGSTNAILPTPDGNFIIAGSNINWETGHYDARFLCITQNGETVWSKRYLNDSISTSAYAIAPLPNGDFIATGDKQTIYHYITKSSKIITRSIINNRYAKKDSLFTFKILVAGDSLKNNYVPLKMPLGMEVSPGGTLSWIPETDSTYLEHVAVLISNNGGLNDTLSFDIIVNKANNVSFIKKTSVLGINKTSILKITQLSASRIVFNVPTQVPYIDIFDLYGRHVQRIKPVNSKTIWNSNTKLGSPVSPGSYIAKITYGKRTYWSKFSVLR